MLRLLSADPFVMEDPSTGEDMLVDPTARTVDHGEGPIPFTPLQESLVPTPTQISEFAAQEATQDAAETLRQAMFDLTDDMIAWCVATQTYLESGGTAGAFSASSYMALLSAGEGLLLQHKSLTVRTQAVDDQRDWMLQRGQQATALLGLAALNSV